MDLARFPRRRYTPFATQLEPAPRLSRELGIALWFKRDDQLGLAGGGNKTRKLEYLIADALGRGADTIITTGAPQSNHARLTAAAAAREGLACRLLIEERVPGSYDAHAGGNNFLFDLLGVETRRVVAAGTPLAAGMEAMAAEARAEGRTPYVIPGGGSNALGALGYVGCAVELHAQCWEAGVAFDAAIVASGSAGTHAGLAAGLAALSWGLPLTGINVRRPRAEQEGNVAREATATAALLGTPAPPREAIVCDDRFVGPGCSLPTPAMVEAVRMTAALEGVLLDPVYTGKAMAGLIGRAREGSLAPGARVLFVHTGGAPALDAFRPVFAV